LACVACRLHTEDPCLQASLALMLLLLLLLLRVSTSLNTKKIQLRE
jgi:hypothetical protein